MDSWDKGTTNRYNIEDVETVVEHSRKRAYIFYIAVLQFGHLTGPAYDCTVIEKQQPGDPITVLHLFSPHVSMFLASTWIWSTPDQPLVLTALNWYCVI